MTESRFKGFSQETLDFFKKLKKNNDKNWFEMHREEYDDYVLNPAKAFVVAMGEKLKKLSPSINADPRTNKSLFRINKDLRFSKDKIPYKTNLGISFWDGPLARMESASFYFHVKSESLMLGAGIYKFKSSFWINTGIRSSIRNLGNSWQKFIMRFRERAITLEASTTRGYQEILILTMRMQSFYYMMECMSAKNSIFLKNFIQKNYWIFV